MAKRKRRPPAPTPQPLSADDVKLIRELFLDGMGIPEIAAKFERRPVEIAEAIRHGKTGELYCSFCCHCQHEVALLIEGNLAYICEACLDLCLQIIKDTRPELLQLGIGKG